MRNAVVLMMMMLLSPLLHAQQPLEVAAGVLQLSEEQTHALVAMVQGRNEALRPIAEKVHADEEALARLLESSSDATAIGGLILEIHAEQQQAAEIAHRAAAQFEAILTPEQQQRLQFIRQAAQVEPAIQALRAVGLL
jgi:Spy/CpxP family protein refolding chaperone